MRRLHILFLAFRNSKGEKYNSYETFQQAKFEHLENEVDAVTAVDDQSTEVKAGLRQLGISFK